jgi:hypothetical protein
MAGKTNANISEIGLPTRELPMPRMAASRSHLWPTIPHSGIASKARWVLVFVSSPSVYWQRRSLNALACLANEIISIRA